MKKFLVIKKLYEDNFHLHGDSPAALLTPKGRNSDRFEVLAPYVADGTTLLDYGSGLGLLYDYLVNDLGKKVHYTGCDIISEFIDRSAEKFPQANFKKIDPDERINGHFDIVFASGVFNLAFDDVEEVAKEYAFSRIKDLYKACSEIFVCDFLTEYVDFKQAGALHFSVGEVSDFCFREFGPRFLIRHNVLPYEFTLIVWKNQKIVRPQNIYDLGK